MAIDPATMDTAVGDIQKQLGLKGLTGDEAQFIQEEIAASKANLAPGGLQLPWQAFNGAQFVDYGPTEFHNALTAAEQFASNTGGRIFPTQDQIQNAEAAGVNFSDPRAFEQYMLNTGMIPTDVVTKYPWLGSGLGQTGYESTLQSYKATWERLTGSVADETDPQWLSHVNGLISQGVGASQYENQVKTDTALQQRFGWLKHGMDYTTFQQYKNDPNNRQSVVARFGVDAANQDQSYLTQLDTATVSLQPPGQAIQAQSDRGQTNLTGRSSVR